MDRKKEILVFFDLEGTIIEEELGKVNDDKINEILNSLSMLEEITGFKVNIHIVSPVFMHIMEEVVDRFDTTIIRYNRKNGKNLREIQSAVAHPDINYFQDNYLYDKIIPMKLSPNADSNEKDKQGKYEYVRNWIETMKDTTAFCIYGGNGFNDTKAMEYVKRSNGLVICPENSYEGVKKIADYVSEKHAADGIKEGLDFINSQILLRKHKEKQGNTQGDTQGDDTESR